MNTVPDDGVGVDVVLTITTVDGGGVVGAADVDEATLTGVFDALVVAIVAYLLGDGPGIRLVVVLRALALDPDVVEAADGVAREGVPDEAEGTGDWICFGVARRCSVSGRSFGEAAGLIVG